MHSHSDNTVWKRLQKGRQRHRVVVSKHHTNLHYTTDRSWGHKDTSSIFFISWAVKSFQSRDGHWTADALGHFATTHTPPSGHKPEDRELVIAKGGPKPQSGGQGQFSEIYCENLDSNWPSDVRRRGVTISLVRKRFLCKDVEIFDLPSPSPVAGYCRLLELGWLSYLVVIVNAVF
ncbi:hypothetical protein JTE90_019346 [Oedothorax gibbosus]|uniref:Uncharacterized protein n=1 Tax=Oedothorax gibbosus TaxID=931172 RepID=A0AAV6UM58_9ARAC|nr:hypothetical protein JTE90_019346 [Oedothorax gibbosus]